MIGYFLPNHLEKLRRIFPKLDIQLFELNREAIEEGLLSNRYDISVLLTSNVLNSDLTTETLLGSRRRLWVAAKHHLLQRESSRPERGHRRTIHHADRRRSRAHLHEVLEQGILPAIGDLADILGRSGSVMVANGQGVAILSDMVFRPWSLEGKRIETIVLRDPVPAMDVGLAWRRNAQFTAPMEAFRSYFRQTFYIPNVR